MKKNLLHLVSTVEHGVGGPGTGAIDLIYSFLLQEHKMDGYSHVQINQIGSDLNEFIIKEGKRIHVNIWYPVYEDFELKTVKEKNLIRLDIIHMALLRIAEKDKKYDAHILETIKNKIIEKDFSFDLIYKSHVNKKNENLVAKIVVHPEEDRFDFYILTEDRGNEKCKILIYSGKTTDFYFDDLFFYGKWKGENEFIIKGKESEIQFHVKVDQCKVDLVNISDNKEKAPLFEIMKSKPDRENAWQDYIDNLNPAMVAILTANLN